MNAELIVWAVIAGICAMALIYRVVESLLHHHGRFHLKHKLIEVGSDAEEFFVPGDRIVRDGHKCYYDLDD